MRKNTNLNASRNQKTHRAATVNVVEKNDGSANIQNGIDAQTQLEARFFESQTNLSASRQRLLNRILDEPHESYFLSSREMARRYGVDSSTIVRTVQAMGYEKFADFAHDLRNHFVTQITPYKHLRKSNQVF